jgi:hypothetical protein
MLPNNDVIGQIRGSLLGSAHARVGINCRSQSLGRESHLRIETRVMQTLVMSALRIEPRTSVGRLPSPKGIQQGVRDD